MSGIDSLDAGGNFTVLTTEPTRPDAPEHDLTTVAVNHELTLSVEDETGILWLTNGENRPLALIGRDGQPAQLQIDANTSVIAIGRDEEGRIVLLGATGDGEPFYPFTLDEDGRIGGGGGALYKDQYQTLEPMFGIDINGDGIVLAGALETVAENGALKLLTDSGNGLAYIQDGKKPLMAIYRDADGNPVKLVGEDFTIVAVARDADGNLCVLNHSEQTGENIAWTLDAKGVWTSQTLIDEDSIADAEALFRKDLNGDGEIAPQPPQFVAKNGDLTLMVDPATGNALVRLEDGSMVTITRGGATDAVKLDHGSRIFAIGRDDMGRLRVLDGNPDGLGKDARAWAWILDANGHFVGEDALSGDKLAKFENIFGKDLNGDGEMTGPDSQPLPEPGEGDPEPRLVAENGDLKLFVDPRTGHALIQLEDGSMITITRGGADEAVMLDRGSKLFAIGRDFMGRLRVFDGNPEDMSADSQHWAWILDETGHFTGENVFKGDQLGEAEKIFGKDFDGDGEINQPEPRDGGPVLVAQNGDLKLYVDTATGLALFQQGDGEMQKIYRFADGDATLLARGSWGLSAIGRDAEGNIRVLDYMEHAGVAYGWKLDADGNWRGETVFNEANNDLAEAIFQKDLNGDGEIPHVPAYQVAKNGDLTLMVDPATGNAMIRIGDADPIALTRDGEPVQLDRGTRFYAIGRDADGNLHLLDGRAADTTADSQHWSWQITDEGEYVSDELIAGDQLKDVEAMFGQDLDGDGKVTGLPMKLVEQSGDNALFMERETGNAYISVAGADPILVTRDGWGDVLQQRGDWGLVAIATDDQGRTRVLDASPFADARFAWILDAEGHFIGEEVFDRDSIGQCETLFGVDLDGSGKIGDGPTTGTTGTGTFG